MIDPTYLASVAASVLPFVVFAAVAMATVAVGRLVTWVWRATKGESCPNSSRYATDAHRATSW